MFSASELRGISGCSDGARASAGDGSRSGFSPFIADPGDGVSWRCFLRLWRGPVHPISPDTALFPRLAWITLSTISAGNRHEPEIPPLCHCCTLFVQKP